MSIERGVDVCLGCPAFFTLSGNAEQFAADPDMPEGRKVLQQNALEAAAAGINYFAGDIACQNTVKTLPSLPEEAPATGTTEAIALAQSCLAFNAYMDRRMAAIATNSSS